MQIEGVKTISQWAGRAERGADTFGSHYSEFEVELYDLTGEKEQIVHDKIREVLINTPGISFELNSFLVERVDETSSGFTSPIVIQIFGNSLVNIDYAGLSLLQNSKLNLEIIINRRKKGDLSNLDVLQAELLTLQREKLLSDIKFNIEKLNVV